MATNKYFNQINHRPEQDLYDQILIESMQIAGIDILYIQRENIDFDKILNEPISSIYKDSRVIEMYMQDNEMAQGEQYFINKMGISFQEFSEFFVNKTRWKEVYGDTLIQPREGDLIYMGDPNYTYSSTINKMYVIKNVTSGHPNRAQFGKEYTYKLIAETFTPSYEDFDTEYEDIDSTYNTDSKEEFINAINNFSKIESIDVLEQRDNPHGEDYEKNTQNNPFGDII